MTVRQSICGLSVLPGQRELLRDAFARLMSVSDDRGYQYLAGIHGFPPPRWCRQNSHLFLPWNRAYLYYFELGLQSRLGQNLSSQPPHEPAFSSVGIPWWDWASDESHAAGLPSVYSDTHVDGQPNHLALAPVIWPEIVLKKLRARGIRGYITDENPPEIVRDPGSPKALPSRRHVEHILAAPTFADFSNRVEEASNRVHAWVAGSMSDINVAAFDPIFWSHRAMIDRLWYLWQNGPYGCPPPASLMGKVLGPFPMTVTQVLDIHELDYEYVVQAYGYDKKSVRANGGQEGVTATTDKATAIEHLTFEHGPEQGASFARAELVFEGVDYSGFSYELRVFLNNRSADDKTPCVPEAGYAGKFTVFGQGGCYGDAGHCDIPEAQSYEDHYTRHPLVPGRFNVSVSKALQKVLLAPDGKLRSMTFVPIARMPLRAAQCPTEALLKYDSVTLQTYR